MVTPKPGSSRQRVWQLHQPGHRLDCEIAFDGGGHGWMVSITLDSHHVGGYRTRTRRLAEAWAADVRATYLADGWRGD